MAAKQRLDTMLVARGLAESRAKAQALALAGLVYSGERRLDTSVAGPLSVSGFARATSPPLCGGEEPPIAKAEHKKTAPVSWRRLMLFVTEPTLSRGLRLNPAASAIGEASAIIIAVIPPLVPYIMRLSIAFGVVLRVVSVW